MTVQKKVFLLHLSTSIEFFVHYNISHHKLQKLDICHTTTNSSHTYLKSATQRPKVGLSYRYQRTPSVPVPLPLEKYRILQLTS